MKQLLLLMGMLFSLIMLALPTNAQSRPTVTIEREGELTIYDGVNCLEDAINASKDGDVLYLSTGSFGSNNSTITLSQGKLKISIIGSGYDSHIISTLEYKANNSTVTYLSPLFEGVRVEKIKFSVSLISYFHNGIIIKNSWIDNLEFDQIKSALVDRCIVGKFIGDKNGTIEMRNCKIKNFKAYGKEKVENCNIIDYVSGTTQYISSSIITKVPSDVGGFTLMDNCVIPQATAEHANIRNCYRVSDTSKLLDEDTLEATEDLKAKGYLGIDGTEVGIYGGQWLPYSENPSVPTVDSKKSTVTYDPNSNSLDVNITVLKD